MQLRFNLTFLHVYLTALIVLLAWTPMAQGAAINHISPPSRRYLGTYGPDASNADVMRRDDTASTTNSAGGDIDGPDGSIDNRYTVVARGTELDNEESVAVGDGDLDKRWYTLIEIAESPDSESE